MIKILARAIGALALLACACSLPRGASAQSINSCYVTYAGTTVCAVLPTKAPLASPVFTGDPQAPTPATTDDDTSLATTAFTHNLLATGGYVDLASPQTITGVKTFTASPLVPTATAGDNSTKAASTAFVHGELTQYAPLASPGLTGTPTAPTAGTATNTNQIATTAFAQALVTAAPHVTSVGLASTDLTCTGSPVTSSGTITCNLAAQAGITAGAYGDASHSLAATVNAKGVLMALSSNSIAIPWSAITSGLPTTLGGYGITDAVSSTATRAANLVFAGPTTGSAVAPTFRSLVAADIPSLSASYLATSTGLTSFAALSWTSGSQVPALISANTWGLKTVGAATGNILDKASGDSLYLGIAATAADSSKLGGTSAASYLLSSTAASTYQPLTTNLTNFNAVTWSSGVQVPLLTGASTWTRATIGTATGNILDKASGDALYLGLTATAADSSKLGGAAAASYAPLASPTFTGTPAVPTAALLTNTNQAASTAFVQAALGGYETTSAAAAADALDEKLANKGAASGYAQLDSSALLPRTIKYAHVNVLTASNTISAGSVFDLQFLKRATTGGLTMTLPTTPTDGWTMEFCDGKGDAATNADTIAAGGADTINGAASVTINTNYGCKRVTYSATLAMWIAR